MKVKSKFLGLTTKLAAALLVLGGTTLTGCYSENDDVKVPFVEPDPVYTITGVALDEKGMPLEGVAVSILSTYTNTRSRATGDILVTGKNGLYTVSSKNNKLGKRISDNTAPYAGENTVKFLYKGKEVSYKVNLATGAAGGASIQTRDVVFAAESGIVLEGTIEHTLATESNSKVVTFKPDTNPELADYQNTSDSEVDNTIDITVKKGVKFVAGKSIDEAFAGVADADTKAALIAYAQETIGSIVAIADMVYPFQFKLPGKSYLSALNVVTVYETCKYVFTYQGVNYPVEFLKLGEYQVNREFASLGHAHGHVHGHSGSFNAGGGIMDALN